MDWVWELRERGTKDKSWMSDICNQVAGGVAFTQLGKRQKKQGSPGEVVGR